MRPRFLDTQNFLFGLFFETHRFAIQYTHTRFLKVNFLKKKKRVGDPLEFRLALEKISFSHISVTRIVTIVVSRSNNAEFIRHLAK